MDNYFQKSLDYQKEFATKWMENFQKLFNKDAKFPVDLKEMTEWYKKMTSSYQAMYEEWSKKFTTDNPFFKAQPWAFNMFQTQETQFDVFNKIMNTSKVYNDLNNLYTKLLGKDPFTSTKDIIAFLKDQNVYYEQLAEDILLPMIPEDGKLLVESSKKVLSKWGEVGKDLTAPWEKSLDSQKAAFDKLAKGDVAAYKDIYEIIMKAYEESYGKVFHIAGLGLTREQNEQFLENFDSFNKMYLAQTELLAFIEDVAKNNMVEVVKKFQESIKNGNKPASMKEFCDLYVKVNDEAFTKIMGGNEFTSLFAEYVKYYASFKQESDIMLEKALSFLPIPKNSDMKELFKTVYDLRKQCYYDHKRIEELENALNTKKEKK